MKQLLTFVFCNIALLTKSQTVDPYIIDHYSPEIVTRMYNLVIKTNINGTKQMAIADIYRAQDSALALMIKNHDDKRAIDSVNSIYQNSWKAILSATDEFYYSTETAKDNKSLRYTYTLLSLAIDAKDKLELSGAIVEYLLSRVDSLKIKEDLFYEQNSTQYFNSFSLQNEYINAVFTDAQYKKLMEIKGKDKAYDKAKDDWKELQQITLATSLNEDSIVTLFANFYLEKDFAYGRYQKNNNAKRRYLQNLYDTEPDCIRQLYYARKYKNLQQNNKPFEFSQFLFAIRNTDKLGMNEEQSKNILNRSNELEKLKEDAYKQDSSKPYDSRTYECTNLKEILTSPQYDQFLILKNSGRAKNQALADWRELTQRNMIQGHDKNSTVAELSNYYLQRLSAYDRNEDNKVLQSEVLKELYDHKPTALTALIKARRNPGNDTQGQGYEW